MNTLKKFSLFSAFTIFLLVALSAVAFLYGRQVGKESSEVQVTNEVILDRITEKYFLVTKSAYLEEEVRITVEENSDWSDLLWKDVITTSGLVRVDLGCDLSNLTAKDITIDNSKKTVTITMPEASILNSSIEGDINVKSERGLVTSLNQLFEPEAQDYNRATQKLKEAALSGISEDVYTEAKSDSKKLIQLIVGKLGYSAIFK